MTRKTNSAGTASTSTSAILRPSKISIIIDQLRREEGATLAEMTAATGWLPHSARAVLTGLRKKGHKLEKTKRGDATCYRITDAA